MPGWETLGILLMSACQVAWSGSEGWDLITDELFTLPGQIRLGGLFAIHTKANTLYNNSQPGPLTCHSFSPEGFVAALAMKFAVEEINNSSALLPRIKLGYEIHDTCLQTVVIMGSVMRFLGDTNSTSIKVLCNYTNYMTRVAAVIGPPTPEMVTATGKLLGFFRVPQISFEASCEKLSDKTVFPSSLRTVPSDRTLAQGMVELLNSLHWDWIGVIGSSDQYGQDGLYQFTNRAAEGGICTAFEVYLPVEGSPTAVNVSKKIIERIVKAGINVTVLFASHHQAKAFLEVALDSKLKMVWIASTGWSLSSAIRQMPGIQNVGNVIGFAVKHQPIVGFEEYVKDILGLIARQVQPSYMDSSPGTCDDGLEEGHELQAFQDTCRECSYLSPANISMVNDPMTQSLAYNVYTAVYSVAQALHKMLQLNSSPEAWQLLKELKTINFTVNNSTFSFDKNGNPNIGYNLLIWTGSEQQMLFRNIGEFTDHLTLHTDLIQWYTGSKPVSTCFKKCPAGAIEVLKGFRPCCYDCIVCPGGDFCQFHRGELADSSLRLQDWCFKETVFPPVCSSCPRGQWSQTGNVTCRPPTYLSLAWTHFFVLTLLSIQVPLLLLVLAVAFLFFVHRRTPLVQACGASLSFLALAGLAAMCCSVFLFVTHPSNLICQLQQPFFAGALSICLSSFLVKSLRVVACTTLPWRSDSCVLWLITHGGWLLVLGLCLVQVFLCGMFVRASPLLSVNMAAMEVKSLTINLSCTIDRIIEFSFMFIYNALLVLVSFICSFLSVKPAHQYNLARDITFSMFIFLFAWIVFIPSYASSTGQEKSLIQAAVILFSCLGILATAFLPKCYILHIQQELNTPEYFRSYLTRDPSRNDGNTEGPATE